MSYQPTGASATTTSGTMRHCPAAMVTLHPLQATRGQRRDRIVARELQIALAERGQTKRDEPGADG